MRDNRVRAALERGEAVIGTMVAEMRSPAVALLFAHAGFDFVFIDMEHGAYDLETVADIIKVARLADIVPLVRVPDGLYHLIARVLDAGAMGVMVPRVETREVVEQAVAALRYPPVGVRGCSTSRGNSDYRGGPLWEFTRHANDNILAVMQIERKAAIDRIDDLLSVPGVDVALIGPADLTLSLGAPSPQDPIVEEAIQRVVDAGRRYGVATGIHLRDVEQLKRWRDRGMTMLTCSTDIDFILNGARAAVSALRR
ncbi:MAG TPA: aldolase [Anaerolineae bacterium]|nr:aldolase [Anaerolineae bacterium]